MVSRILGNDHSQTVTPDHVTQAREELIQRRDTHLDSLIDKLREPAVRGIVEALIGGETLVSDRLNDNVAYIQDLGLITRRPPIRFANPIYAEIIPRVLNYGWQLSFNPHLVDQAWYVRDGRLDMDALLEAFQSETTKTVRTRNITTPIQGGTSVRPTFQVTQDGKRITHMGM